MKIVCDACQAKYSISDDKVQGKVFKIRCKKCSNVIVVRGGAGAAEPTAAAQQARDSSGDKDTRVYDYGQDAPAAAEDAVWHLVIQQEQVGPMTAGDVQHRFASGEIDSETFAWREGFADWTPLAQIDVFAALVANGSAAAPVSADSAAAIGAMFGGLEEPAAAPSRDANDLFAPPPAAAPMDDDGSDLFAPTQAAASAAAAAHKLRGERNENSVLFSLNNLAQLASDRPASSPTAPSPMSAGPASAPATSAGGEGSGLIDIRSMASAYLGNSAGATMGKPATSSAIGSIDDLPVFGGGGFSEPAVIVPTAQSSSNNKLLYLMMSAVALLAVVAVVMVVLLVKGGKDKVVVAEGAAAKSGGDVKSGETKEPETGSAKPDPRDGVAKPSGGTDSQGSDGVGTGVRPDPAATTKPPDTVKKPDPTPKKPIASGNTGAGKSAGAGGTAAVKPDPTTATAKPEPAKVDSGGGSCDEVSCVLNNYEGACCAKFRKGGSKPSGGGTKPAGGGDLPDALDRAMISSGIAAVKARVTACGDRSQAKGKVRVHVKVGGDGRVSNVSVESSPDPALGSCVSAAVQKASFAKTASGGSFVYPFVF